MIKMSFLDWVKEKLSFGSKKKFAGATMEDDYFQCETFKGVRSEAKPTEAGEGNDSIREDAQTPVKSSDISGDQLIDESLVSGEVKQSSTKGSSSSTLGYKSLRKKKNWKRMTVIPTAAVESPAEKFNQPINQRFNQSIASSSSSSCSYSRDGTLKKSRMRFSFMGTLRKKFRKESYSNSDIGASSKVNENLRKSVGDCSGASTEQRSKRILSAPSLKTYGGKRNSAEDKGGSSPGGNVEEDESSNYYCFGKNDLDKTDSLTQVDQSHVTSIGSTSPQEVHFRISNGFLRETPRRNNTISLAKVSTFFPTPPYSVHTSPNCGADSTPLGAGADNDYVGFNASRNQPSQKSPQSPNHRNSDPYVNLQFHKFNLYGGSQESVKEDNYCLKPDDDIPAVPPRTYKRNYPSSNFSRSTRSYQSFSSFSSLVVSNGNINKTLQQLPKSVALKCEAFCKRVDALSSDYLPMNMHPLSNRLSDN